MLNRPPRKPHSHQIYLVTMRFNVIYQSPSSVSAGPYVIANSCLRFMGWTILHYKALKSIISLISSNLAVSTEDYCTRDAITSVRITSHTPRRTAEGKSLKYYEPCNKPLLRAYNSKSRVDAGNNERFDAQYQLL